MYHCFLKTASSFNDRGCVVQSSNVHEAFKQPELCGEKKIVAISGWLEKAACRKGGAYDPSTDKQPNPQTQTQLDTLDYVYVSINGVGDRWWVARVFTSYEL